MLNCPMLLAIIGVALLAVCWLLTVLPFIRVYSAWVGGHPIYAAEVAIALLMLLGALGSGFGVSNLFWHEDWWVQACAGASVAVLASFLWWLSLVASATPRQLAADAERALRQRWWLPRLVCRYPAIEISETPAIPLRRYAWGMFWPLGTLLILVAATKTIVAYQSTGNVTPWSYAPLPIGAGRGPWQWSVRSVAIARGSFFPWRVSNNRRHISRPDRAGCERTPYRAGDGGYGAGPGVRRTRPFRRLDGGMAVDAAGGDRRRIRCCRVDQRRRPLQIAISKHGEHSADGGDAGGIAARPGRIGGTSCSGSAAASIQPSLL